MFKLFKGLSRKRLSFDQLQVLQLITQQVVWSVEGTAQMPGAQKKAIALELVGQVMRDMDLVAPNGLVDAMIESAVRILNMVESKRLKVDVSGHPLTGSYLAHPKK